MKPYCCFKRWMIDNDDCEDAALIEVVHYLRGCRSLDIPQEWRQVLPEKL